MVCDCSPIRECKSKVSHSSRCSYKNHKFSQPEARFALVKFRPTIDPIFRAEGFMVQIRVLGLAILFPVLLLAACAIQGNTAGQAVAAYFQALVDKDAEKLASLSCRDWR